MAFQARNTHRAARIYETMLRDPDCSVMLCLAGSLVSAGLKKVILEMIENSHGRRNRVDGRQHRRPGLLRGARLLALASAASVRRRQRAARARDRPHLRHLHRRGRAAHLRRDHARRSQSTRSIRPYSRASSSRDGPLPAEHGKNRRVDRAARVREGRARSSAPRSATAAPGSDSSKHQYGRPTTGKPTASIDSAKDFLELTRIKMRARRPGLFMIGGGVPKNFAQDIVVARRHPRP